MRHDRTKHHDVGEGVQTEQRNDREHPVDESPDSAQPPREVAAKPLANDRKTAKARQVLKVHPRNERGGQLASADSQTVGEDVEPAQVGIVEDHQNTRRAGQPGFQICEQRLDVAVVVERAIDQDGGSPIGLLAQIGKAFVLANSHLFDSRNLGEQQTAVFFSWKPLDHTIAVPGETRQFLGKERVDIAFPTPRLCESRGWRRNGYSSPSRYFRGHFDLF